MKDRFKFRIAVFERHNTDEWEFNKFIENTDKLGVSTNGNVIQESVQGFIIHLPRDKTPKNVWRTMEAIQSTGLKDKNDKLICEGDIVKVYNHVGQIIYDQRGCYFGLKVSNSETWGFSLSFMQHQHIEVIGNIYEDSELLKGGKND